MRIYAIPFFLLVLLDVSKGEEDEEEFKMENWAPPPPLDKSHCTAGKSCSELGFRCLNCSFPKKCVYGDEVNATCSPQYSPHATCPFCYQLPAHQMTCDPRRNCSTTSVQQKLVLTVCRANEEVLCKGNRVFYRKIRCNWTSGYRWSTAFILSVTLGGFGADRFYLGLWQSGLGKLFSFGGLGVWTLIDVVLIASGYVRPADGSVYIN